MRFIRLQQKHGFKTKGKGTPRRQRAPDANKEATDEKEPEDTEEAIENWLSLYSEERGVGDDMQQWNRFLTLTSQFSYFWLSQG